MSILLDKQVDRALDAARQPDTVVAATGASPITLHLPGSDLSNTVQATEAIAGEKATGQRVCVVGGRHDGMETALGLADEGKTVTIVEMKKVGGGSPVQLKACRRHLGARVGRRFRTDLQRGLPVLQVRVAPDD